MPADQDQGEQRSVVKVERNARLKFRRRALVAMVANEQNSTINDQFFITLSDAAFLDGLHPIIGTVVGNSVFNMLAIAAHGSVDDPSTEHVPRILNVTVTENPFKDIVPVDVQKSILNEVSKEVATEKENNAKRAVRSDTLLSFAGKDDDDDDDDSDDSDDQGKSMLSSWHTARRRRGANGAGVSASSTACIDLRKRLPPVTSTSMTTSTTTSTPISSMHTKMVNCNTSTSATTKSASDSAKGTPEAIMAAATAEFEALKQEMLGPSVDKDNEKDGVRNDKKRDSDERMTGREREKDRDNGRLPVRSGGVSKRRRTKAEEDEVLSRLKAFEERLVGARKMKLEALNSKKKSIASAGRGMGDEGDMAGRHGNAAWFVRGLRLRPTEDDGREYDVVDYEARDKLKMKDKGKK